MAARRRPWAESLLAALARPLLRHLREVEVDEAALLALRELAERGPIVFLPAHRSYLDSLVLADVLREAGSPDPGGSRERTWRSGRSARSDGVVE